MIIILDTGAERDLEKLEASLRRRIIRKLEFYALQDNPARFAERLVKSEFGDYRFRVGDYRVICDIGVD